MSGIYRTMSDEKIVHCASWVESLIYLSDFNKMWYKFYLLQFWKVFIFFQNSEILLKSDKKIGTFHQVAEYAIIQFGTNNTQNVANLGDNWRKIR